MLKLYFNVEAVVVKLRLSGDKLWKQNYNVHTVKEDNS